MILAVWLKPELPYGWTAADLGERLRDVAMAESSSVDFMVSRRWFTDDLVVREVGGPPLRHL